MVKTTSKSYSSRMAADTRNYQARSLSGHSMAWVVHIRWCMDSWTKLPGRPVDRAEDPAHQRRAWEYHVRFQIRVFHFTASVEVYNREWSFGNRGVRLKQIWSTCSMGHVPFRKRGLLSRKPALSPSCFACWVGCVQATYLKVTNCSLQPWVNIAHGWLAVWGPHIPSQLAVAAQRRCEGWAFDFLVFSGHHPNKVTKNHLVSVQLIF